jgi:hypothetical protein
MCDASLEKLTFRRFVYLKQGKEQTRRDEEIKQKKNIKYKNIRTRLKKTGENE